MSTPCAIFLDRDVEGPLDLTSLIESPKWSSVVPGGFASCSFNLQMDPREATKIIPYLSIVRVVGQSGRVLFEGQVEDKGLEVASDSLSLPVTAFGLQNALQEDSVRRIWSKRDMQWVQASTNNGMRGSGGGAQNLNNQAWTVNVGQYDTVNPTRTGVQIVGSNELGTAVPNSVCAAAEFDMPIGLTAVTLLGSLVAITRTGYVGAIWATTKGNTYGNALQTFGTGVGGTFSQDVTGNEAIRLGAYVNSGGGATIGAGDGASFYDLRILGTAVTEDVTGGFYGDTLIRDLLAQVPALGAGVIESGSDFTIDHLDAGSRRFAYDILQEIAAYYAREWAVWEDAKLHWVTPNLGLAEWMIPMSAFSELRIEASTVNSRQAVHILYTDAASGLEGEQSSSSSDRRNPYVLKARAKDILVQAGRMTSTTAAQLASRVQQEIGFGPIPASGTCSLLGQTIIQNAQGNAVAAWEIRAGDNILIPELPMADVFMQDGRGETLFHVIAAEADGDSGIVSLTLDSYGSKRTDVLLARLAAVTNLLGG